MCQSYLLGAARTIYSLPHAETGYSLPPEETSYSLPPEGATYSLPSEETSCSLPFEETSYSLVIASGPEAAFFTPVIPVDRCNMKLVNLNKSKVYGVGVSRSEVENMARCIGCSVGELPLTYLGLPIGIWADGAMSDFVGWNGSRSGVWGDIVRVGRDIERLGVCFSSFFTRKVGDGSCMSFWDDRWVGRVRLRDQFPRLYHLDTYKVVKVAERRVWGEEGWRWAWDWVREPREGR
nr:hypothetical protein [Tanacetum cinerariifolium]